MKPKKIIFDSEGFKKQIKKHKYLSFNDELYQKMESIIDAYGVSEIDKNRLIDLLFNLQCEIRKVNFQQEDGKDYFEFYKLITSEDLILKIYAKDKVFNITSEQIYRTLSDEFIAMIHQGKGKLNFIRPIFTSFIVDILKPYRKHKKQLQAIVTSDEARFIIDIYYLFGMKKYDTYIIKDAVNEIKKDIKKYNFPSFM